MNQSAYREFVKKIKDGERKVYPPHYHEKFVSIPEKYLSGEMTVSLHAGMQQMHYTLGYLAGMRKARKLLMSKEAQE